jgi:putative ABC transport system permease protein
MRFRDVNVNGKIIGTVPWALKQSQLTITDGRFIDQQDLDEDANVVVLSKAAAAALFVLEYPIGKNIYLGTQSYHVIGIVSVPGNPSAEDGAGAKEIYDVYIPITAARTRFGEVMLNMDRGAASLEKVELHQLTLSTPSEDSVIPIAEAVRETMRHTHRRTDYEITVPLELLKQAEQTKRIFNIVLGSIAAISLLVGGIGIMNIMLASVTERTREIGIRRALGATRSDIVVQFLTEALLLSLFGGIIGIGLGVGVPMIVTHFAGLVTIVQPDSILLAFSISLLTGIIFGIYPAIRAAALSPIEALRHE